MKKLLSVLLVLIMIMLCFTFSVSALESKITSELNEILEISEPYDVIGIGISFNGQHPNATEMPSWPDVTQARKELKEYYDNWYKNEIVPKVFDSIEYEELFVGSGTVIVSVRVCDVEKIADSELVQTISYYKNTDYDYADDYKYKDKFMELISPFELGDYDEPYYHTDENGDVDWALIYASTTPADPIIGRILFCDVVIEADCAFTPFVIRYGLYDATTDEFLRLDEVDVSQYEGLEEVVKSKAKYSIRVVGDVDGDNELSIIDATYIQLAVAQLCEFPANDFLDDYNPYLPIKYLSDFDRDGERTILDATAIQLKLAGISE